MTTTFDLHGDQLRISTDPAPELPNSCSCPPTKGHVHITVDRTPLGGGDIRRLLNYIVPHSHARAIASAILSAATESRQ